MEVGLGPGDFVFAGDQLLPQKKGHDPNPVFAPCLLWPNGWMDQDATWYGSKPRSRRRCVRWGCSSIPLKGTHPPVSARVCCGQTAGWMKTPLGTEVDLGQGHIVLDGDAHPPRKRHSRPPILAHISCGHGRQSQLLLGSCYSFKSRSTFQVRSSGLV